MTIRDHYIVVPVTPAEVQFERESVTQQLAKLPVVGLLVQAWFAPRSEEEFDAMGAELTERLRRVERGYGRLRAVPHRASTPTRWRRCSRHSFWNGEIRDEGEMGERIRTTPLIGGMR